MSGRFVRILVCLLLSSVVVACGGGGGGGNKPPASSAAPVDTDGDTHPDSQDLFPNDPKEWADTDKDGVGNNGDAFPNDASETLDTDKDGVGDNKDQFPNDANETVDTDKDGVGDRGDATPMGQPIPAWTTYQANLHHTGRVDITLDVTKFRQRWTSTDGLSFPRAVAADGYVFVVNSTDTLQALESQSGTVLWTHNLGFNSLTYSHPVYADGMVYVINGDFNNSILWAFNASDGKLVFKSELPGYSSYLHSPVIVDGTVYIGGGSYNDLSYAIDAKTGHIKWEQFFSGTGYSVPAIVGEYVVEYGNNPSSLIARDRATGNVAFAIPDSLPNWSTWGTVPVVAGDYVLVNNWFRLAAFNLATRQFAWEVSGAEFNSQPVVKGDRWYTINKGVIEIRSLATGELIATIKRDKPFIEQLLITKNLLFARDETSTFAYELEGNTLVWTLKDKTGAMIMAEGALLVQAAGGIVAMDVQAELDDDGLPDWWEQRFGWNFDPAADNDGDGLTALQEFTLGTHPLIDDTDGDGLFDGAEVAKGKSSPLQQDTDGDGLDDKQELNTYKTDPSTVDTDGDGFGDAEEIAIGFNPLDGKDAFADTDGDGFSNMHELRANTSINDANSRPQIGEWVTRNGNARRNSYTPLLLSEAKFSERWSTTASSFGAPVTVAGRLILTSESLNRIQAWDSGTGAEIWSSTAINAGHYIYPSVDAGKVVQAYSGPSGLNLVVSDANTGIGLLTKVNGYSYNSSHFGPLVSDGRFYDIDYSSRQVKAFSLADGNQLWSTALGDQYYGYGNPPLVGNDQLVVPDRDLKVFTASTGTLLKTIDITGLNTFQAVLGANNNLLLTVSANGSLTSVDLATGSRSWTSSDCKEPSATAVGNGKVYALTYSGLLCAIDENTGALAWSAQVSNGSLSSNLVLTASHLFYSTGATTYAVDLALKKVTWHINKGASSLALAADGTLYLVGSSDITAIDTEGDTDGDGLLQWWERRYGGDLDPTADTDQDGLTNLQEFTAKTNPLAADTDGDGLSDSHEINNSLTDPLAADMDKDGLSDGFEINTTNTNPDMVDTDADGLEDNREVTAGLDGNNKDDAALDNDGDGFSNRDEMFSGTNLNDAGSKPVAGHWAMEQANVGRTGFQPYKLDEANFSLRWSKAFDTSIRPVIAVDNQVFVTQNDSYNGNNKVMALNVSTGEQQWEASVAYAGALGYRLMTNQVAVATGYPQGLQLLDATTGAAAAHMSSVIGSTGYSPVIEGTVAYTKTSNQLEAVNLDNGQPLWSVSVLGYGTERIVLNDQYLFYKQVGQIHVHERASGALAFTLDTPSISNGHLVLGSRNNILDINSQRIVSFDLATRKQNWSRPVSDNAYFDSYALANGQLYIRDYSSIYSINEITGALSWKWDGSVYGSSNIVATLTHVFVSSGTKTYALSATTGEQLWSYDAGGSLALGTDGALYIQSSNQLVAINLEGDSDNDGMPDWWERRYGLNSADASDAALDLDSDGLTNREEFTAHSYANNPDSDADGLNDADEVNTRHTNPVSADTDMDDLVDGWEVSNSLNPLDPDDRDQDLDGDSIPNYMEYLASTDPNNALSLPPMFTPDSYSFEDGVLPAGWELSDATTSVQIVSNNASDGTRSLELRYAADISFEGYFFASDLTLDIKGGCSNSYRVEVYIDDQLVANDYAASQWRPLKATIPLGRHKVSLRTNSYDCAIYLDNLVLTPAVSNTELAVEWVGVYDNLLKFVSIDGEVVRTLGAVAPQQGHNLADMTALGNGKLLLAYQGNNSFLRVLDLTTFNWRDISIDAISSSVVAKGNFAYLPTYNSSTGIGSISRVNLSTGAITRFGSHNYSALALDTAGFIHAYANGVVYKYDPSTLALVSQVATVNAHQILVDSNNRLIVVSYNEVIRYNAQRVIDARITSNYGIRSVALNDKGELFVADQSLQVRRYSTDWVETELLAIPVTQITTFSIPDSDSDGLFDWWELRNGLNPADAADSASDSDNDGLTALEEYELGTNAQEIDTDGDLLTDGDEVNVHTTNPLAVDTDGDHLTDSKELNQYMTNPLLADSDTDGIDDYQVHAPALVNFAESFEGAVVRWITSADANAGWTGVSDKASNGSRSLRSGTIGDSQKAAVEWTANFNQSTLSFDAFVSSENCCDRLEVYVDNVYRLTVNNNDQWQSQSLSLSAGFHIIKFVYQKDGSSIGGSDAAWIDNIRVQ